jgi:hypothetical protein
MSKTSSLKLTSVMLALEKLIPGKVMGPKRVPPPLPSWRLRGMVRIGEERAAVARVRRARRLGECIFERLEV